MSHKDESESYMIFDFGFCYIYVDWSYTGRGPVAAKTIVRGADSAIRH